jgi:hypothetical protein
MQYADIVENPKDYARWTRNAVKVIRAAGYPLLRDSDQHRI